MTVHSYSRFEAVRQLHLCKEELKTCQTMRGRLNMILLSIPFEEYFMLSSGFGPEMRSFITRLDRH